MTSILRATLFVTLSCLGCANVRPPAPVNSDAVEPDSLVMERMPCLGRCPVYRLRISRTGHVHYSSDHPSSVTSLAIDTIDVREYQYLLGELTRLEFHSLPERPHCTRFASDHSTVTTTVVTGDSWRRVEHYTGCREPVELVNRLNRLRAFYTAVDSIARTQRWTRSF